MYDPLDFIDYLKEMMYLKDTTIDIEELICNIIMSHTVKGLYMSL